MIDDRRAAWAAKMARVGGGLGLGLTIVLVATVWALGPTRRELAVVLILAAANAVVLPALVRLVPWHRADERLLLVFPLSGLAGMATVGLLTDAITRDYTALTVTAFLYAGISQRPWTSLWLLPAALPTWLLMHGEFSAEVWIRALVAVLVWILVAEVTSRRTWSTDTALTDMEHLARRDALTGLLNRRTMAFRLGELRSGDALLLLDVDHFKKVNDTSGHQTGDAVLASLGRLILATARDEDNAFRYGGEEVLVLLPAGGLDGGQRFDQRLRTALSTAHPGITYSAGLAILGDQESGATALRRADQALYEAKTRGRNRTALSRPPAPAGPRRRMRDCPA